MSIWHLSRSPWFRSPTGAARTETEITFTLLATDGDAACSRADIHYAYGLNDFQESRIRMTLLAAPKAAAIAFLSGIKGQNFSAWRVRLRLPAEAGLFFYWFSLRHDEKNIYYSIDPESLSASGRTISSRPRFNPAEQQQKAWQITVFARDFQVPDWLAGAVIYQIFPDRFARDSSFSLQRFRQNAWPERIFHEHWDEEVDYKGKPETGYLACDFFGGSINGIRERLSELTELGINAIYLNPIFRARSNHRYDTGDYEQIDPLLGSTEDFQKLCQEAAARDINIILDGVFSHTGADSRYFNKLERYAKTGAYQEMTGSGISPFSSWYTFHRRGEQIFYDSWWGFTDLPCVNEYDLSFQDYIAGPEGIIKKWLRLGASGWRLDVSDELPDSFLRLLRRAVKSENSQAAIMGEVWEDASCKISYGAYRDFLFGRTHDNVMGYPFQQALLGWLAGQYPATKMRLMLENLQDHYPLPSFYSNYNLISSHDISRALTVLAGVHDPGNRESQADLRLSGEQRTKGKKLLRLAYFFQIVFPGAAAIYYGDEIGMEGFRDPFNRRTYPVKIADDDNLRPWFCRLGQLRRWPVLRSGYLRIIKAGDDYIVLCRYLNCGRDVFGRKQDGPQHVLAALNRCDRELSLQLCGRELQLSPCSVLLESDGEKIDLSK